MQQQGIRSELGKACTFRLTPIRAGFAQYLSPRGQRQPASDSEENSDSKEEDGAEETFLIEEEDSLDSILWSGAVNAPRRVLGNY